MNKEESGDSMSTNEERERFEAWMSDGGKYPLVVERVRDGYKLIQADSAWRVWQAKAADSAAATQKLIDGLEEIAYGKDQWTAVGMVEIASDVLRDYRSALKGDGGKV